MANILLFLALSAAEQRRGWVGNRVLVAFEQEIVFWPDYSDNSAAPIIGPRGHTHYHLYSNHQGAAPTAGAQFLLKLASGAQSPRHRENSVAGHDEAELITSLGDTVIHSTLLIQLPVHPHRGLPGQIM